MENEKYVERVSEDYKNLVSKALEVDYVIGPKLNFNVGQRLLQLNGSIADKVCNCEKRLSARYLKTSPEKSLIQEEYNKALFASFYAQIQQQASQEGISVEVGSDDILALFVQNDKATENNQLNTFVFLDENNHKYIRLTQAGESLFRQTFCGCKDYDRGVNKVFLDSPKIDVDLVAKKGKGKLVSKSKTSPSLLVLNTNESDGFTDEYIADDDLIIGPRSKVVRGNTSMNYTRHPGNE